MYYTTNFIIKPLGFQEDQKSFDLVSSLLLIFIIGKEGLFTTFQQIV